MTGQPDHLRAITSSVSQASPDQIVQIVATIDRLDQRGVADRLLVSLRERMTTLGVARPLSLRRLSFEPIDHLIQDARLWKRGGPMVPRSALMALFSVMRNGNPDYHHAEALLPMAQCDEGVRRKLCQMLWRDGARALAAASPPADWRESSGLAGADFHCLRGIVAGVLTAAPQIRALDARGDPARLAAGLRDILTTAAKDGGAPAQAVLLVLCRKPGLAAPAMKVAGGSALMPGMAGSLESASAWLSASLQERLESLTSSGRLSAAGLDSIIEIINGMEDAAGPHQDRKRGFEQLRLLAMRSCAVAVERATAQLMAMTEASCQPDSACAEDSIAERQNDIEAAARETRLLASIGGSLGMAEKCEAQLKIAIDRLTDPASTLALMDRARLLELLGRRTLALGLIRQTMAGG